LMFLREYEQQCLCCSHKLTPGHPGHGKSFHSTSFWSKVTIATIIINRLNLIKTKRNLLYIKNQSVPRCKHFPPRL
jgi:hypothetical protein